MTEALTEMLKNKKDFPNETKISLGGGKETTLGDLRDYFSAGEREINTKKSQYETKLLEAERLQQEAATFYAQLQESRNSGGAAPVPTRQVNPADDPLSFYEGSADFEPFVKTYRRDRDIIATALRGLNEALGNNTKMLTHERWDRQYDRATGLLKDVYSEGESIPDRQSLIKQAADNRDFDEFNTPNIYKTAERMRQTRMEARQKSELEASYKKIKDAEAKAADAEARANGSVVSMPRPGNGGAPRTVKPAGEYNKKDPFGSAIEAARQDPSIWKAAVN